MTEVLQALNVHLHLKTRAADYFVEVDGLSALSVDVEVDGLSLEDVNTLSTSLTM